MKKINKNSPGFTLIETLVAIAIFAFAITGLITVTGQGVFDTNFVKNKFTAGYLALEGAELVRNIRDTTAIENLPWSLTFPGTGGNNYLGPCMRSEEEACAIDAWVSDSNGLPVPVDCPVVSCPAMSFNTGTGRFSYENQDNNTIFASIFTRTIYIVPVSPPNNHEQTVVSEVSWKQGTRTHKVVYSFNLLDWAGP